MAITVRGKYHEWSFSFRGNEEYLDEWREDGLQIDVIENEIPDWVNEIGLTPIWCLIQDIWRNKRE